MVIKSVKAKLKKSDSQTNAHGQIYSVMVPNRPWNCHSKYKNKV